MARQLSGTRRQHKQPLIWAFDALLLYYALFALLPNFFPDALVAPGLPQLYFFIMSFWVVWGIKLPWREWGFVTPTWRREIGLGLALGMVPLAIVLLGWWWLPHHTVAEKSTSVISYYSIFLLVVAAPIAEEWFFRGLLARFLLRQFKPRYVVLVTAMVFAISHFRWQPGPFLLGLATTALYVWRRNLLAVIVLHAICNAIGPLLYHYLPQVYDDFKIFFLS